MQAITRTSARRGWLRGARGRGLLVALCLLAAVGLSAGPAQAITYSQQTLAFSGLEGPYGVAVDAAGDVYVTDTYHSRVVELPAGGAQGDQGPQGPAGPARPAAPKPTGETIQCTTKLTTFTCTVTYIYSAASAALSAHARAEATTKVHGHAKVIGTGTIHDHKLELRFKRLKRGRYHLTLLQLRRGRKALVIGHTTLTIS